MKVDIIFANSSTESEAARRATNTVPIVFSTHFDPVGVGHVASLAHPGGNITGVAALGTELAAKQLELLKATVPRVTRFGVLYTPTTPAHRPVLQAAEAARGKLDIQLLTVGVNTGGISTAFAKMAHGRVGAVFVQAAALTSELSGNARPLAELALKHRLLTMFGNRDNAVAGGLMSYAPNYVELYRRAAVYIDKILKGAKPADLPVEQPTKFELVINRKTAKALGLTIPQTLLLQANAVIE